MKEDKRKARRRKWKRFEAKTGAVVILNKPYLKGVLGRKRIELGPIINISMGGLAVQYVENKERTAEYSELSIYFPEDGITLDKIPFEVISDYEVARMPDEKTIRMRCVKFGTLTTYQVFRLEEFIKKRGAKTLEDRRANKDRRQANDPPNNEAVIDRRGGKDRRSASKNKGKMK